MQKYWSEDLMNKLDDIVIAKSKEWITDRKKQALEQFIAEYGYKPYDLGRYIKFKQREMGLIEQ